MLFINQEAILLISLVLVLFFCSVLYLYIYITDLISIRSKEAAKKAALALREIKVTAAEVQVNFNPVVVSIQDKNAELAKEIISNVVPLSESLSLNDPSYGVQFIKKEVEDVIEEEEEEEDKAFFEELSTDVLRVLGNFEVYRTKKKLIKWRLLSPKKEILLESTADYSSEVTGSVGVEAAIRVIRGTPTKPSITIVSASPRRFKVILKSGNGKIIGESPIQKNKEDSEKVMLSSYVQIKITNSVISEVKEKKQKYGGL